MMPSALRTGFLATLGGAEPVAGVPDGAAHERFEAISLSLWGRPAVDDGHEGRRTFVVSRVARRRDGALDGGEIADAMAVDPALLHDLLPPFGAIQASGGTLRFSGDWMGFEHVFAHDGPGSVMLSTSALLIAERVAAGFDPVGVAVQSQLGWQLASRTLFDGVRKLPPSASASLTADGLSLAADADAANPTDDAAVPHAAGILRRSLERLLDEHPDAVLQLTGGMDSRLLLSAIPPERRRGLHAMTLDVPGAGDVAVARDIARRFGIEHEVHGFAGLDDLSPEDAWASCRAEATRLDCMTDPVALAAQRNAERAFAQGVRISGLGGEVARGFYYVGDVDDRTYERKDAARLADWKLFVNEAVEPGLLTAEFADWARERAVDEVHDALRRGGDEWFRATDALYLRHRMQRWAGATDIAVSDQRVVVNPMLDRDFLAIVSGLPPREKANARFLARLQMALDPELGRLPLEGRPAPASYAEPSAWEGVAGTYRTARRLARKAAQRLRHRGRAPAGGEELAAKVVAHWRAHPAILDGVVREPFVSERWVAAVLDGAHEPRPSSVALLTNLAVAAEGR
ncbi:asparagine synthase-related protein [Agrococcus carbonis]|uniref:Asparagine synthase (Glutamine-hydrolysing) n=1 Tax=Agrococcus carbonis TaxID=684552 RepID=A0A1H1LDX5_9MICO|nr:asparagine synthase-related protein [Agrococcus carbonis]SDR72079.1 asparagine synthase (glutamine-hydrolysing) [Agrococcus carbonis]